MQSLLRTGARARQEKRLQRYGWVSAGGVGQRRRHLEGLKHAEVAEAVEKCWGTKRRRRDRRHSQHGGRV